MSGVPFPPRGTHDCTVPRAFEKTHRILEGRKDHCLGFPTRVAHRAWYDVPGNLFMGIEHKRRSGER